MRSRWKKLYQLIEIDVERDLNVVLGDQGIATGGVVEIDCLVLKNMISKPYP